LVLFQVEVQARKDKKRHEEGGKIERKTRSVRFSVSRIQTVRFSEVLGVTMCFSVPCVIEVEKCTV